MNYKLNNPVAFKVIECLMLDRPVSTKKVVECAKLFDYDINQALCYCLRYKIITYDAALYIYKMYRMTFKNLINNRNHELKLRNVLR